MLEQRGRQQGSDVSGADDERRLDDAPAATFPGDERIARRPAADDEHGERGQGAQKALTAVSQPRREENDWYREPRREQRQVVCQSRRQPPRRSGGGKA